MSGGAQFDDQMLARLGEAALRIHQGGREWSLDSYQERAFEVLRGLIPFDSGMWGTASNDPNRMHSVHLDHQPPAMIEAYVTGGFQETDPIRATVSANPGVTVRLFELVPMEEFCASSHYRDFSRNWDIACTLCTVQIEPVSSLIGFMSLWRSDPRNDFSESERRIKQFLVPHMMDAHREARLRHLRALAPAAGPPRRASAICDRFGILHALEDSFLAILREEWPAWHSALLPQPLIDLLGDASGHSYRSAAVEINATPIGDLALLEARRTSAIDRLTAREREIAEFYAAGKSNQEIADILGISAATVRNHLSALYRKLDIANKAQLGKLVAEAQS